MRVLVFHGYLLRGTGSNVYNANLARALVTLGHEVDLLCQDAQADELPFVGAVGEWRAGELTVRRVRDTACTVYRPPIGELLPVYVADRYDGFNALAFPELSDAELCHYLEANVIAVREIVERRRPDVALANHLVMGPVILARALAGTGVRYAAKVHGSALEYTVKPHPRFLPYAQEGIAAAAGVLVGSRHTAESLWRALGDDALPARTRLGPPGVDVSEFTRRPPDVARRELDGLARRLEAQAAVTASPTGDSAFERDLSEAYRALRALAELDDGPCVGFVGKLIISKGIDLLLAAWPLVLAEVPDARLVVTGFGAFREGAEEVVSGLSAGDLGVLEKLARTGRAAEGGPAGRLEMLSAFLDQLERTGEREAYLRHARRLGASVLFTGRLEHAELASALAMWQALVVPSTFPEAFGMVLVEAAACGALPIAAAHSGLAEVTRVLGAQMPERISRAMSFPLGHDVVPVLARRICAWLGEPPQERETISRAMSEVARARYSWEQVASGVIAAAQGDLDKLPTP